MTVSPANRLCPPPQNGPPTGLCRPEMDPNRFSNRQYPLLQPLSKLLSPPGPAPPKTILAPLCPCAGDQQEDWRLWVYVPRTSDIADADHPICQSYVDTVLEGCLFHCTGEAFAREFLQTTLDWPKYFLDDTPLSRRPWLNRPHYKVIDALLREQTEHTRLHHRKHPEEFATAYLRIIRGMWGVPNRNPLFVGREAELALLRERLCGPPAAPRRTAGIIQLETVGLGGIGKTQLAIELCHRLYNTAFPLILWLRAESPDLIAEDLRRLARDVGIDVMDRSSEDINQVPAEFTPPPAPPPREAPGWGRGGSPPRGTPAHTHNALLCVGQPSTWGKQCGAAQNAASLL